MGDQGMRCFFAIEFDEETRQVLTGIQNALRGSGISGNYTRPPNFHLTLKFLGEISPSMLPRLERVMGKVASKHDSFVLELGELGKFSKGKRPVIWCGLKTSKPLLDLQKDLVEELAAEFSQFSGYERHAPHITLIREAAFEGPSRGMKADGRTAAEGALLDNLLGKVQKPDHSITVRGISLMESTRVDGRLVYLRKLFLALRDQ